MDKKKVEVHIENVSKILGAKRKTLSAGNLEHLQNELKLAMIELSKSDWISVEEELPPFNEEVLVRDMNAKSEPWSKPWICYRSEDEAFKYITDKHKFVTTRFDSITHWKHIEK